MYQVLKPLLFSLAPEKAHHLTIKLFDIALAIPGGKRLFSKLYSGKAKSLERTVCGLTFKNPVGLAAGFDKDGKYYHQMSHLGFGFIEIGTVTPRPQGGNPRPRLFRLPKDEALINRMGFNNDGVEAMVARLEQYGKPPGVILGGNIGKNKTTPNADAVNDYVICFKALHHLVDYFVVNVSSPNTPGLRELQEKEPLTRILKTLVDLNTGYDIQRPILLKIAPDLTDSQLDDIADIVDEVGIDGVIATNTTIDRSSLTTSPSTVDAIGAGGLSGKPVTTRSTEVIKYLADRSQGRWPIIGVGGVDDGPSAAEKIKAGASLVQVYTGLVYQGPGLIKRICQHLAR